MTNVAEKLYNHHYSQFWNTVKTHSPRQLLLSKLLSPHPLSVPCDCRLLSPGSSTVPVGMRAGTHPTGSADGVSIVTFLAVLTVIPSGVVLTVLGTDEEDSELAISGMDHF